MDNYLLLIYRPREDERPSRPGGWPIADSLPTMWSPVQV